jgi:PAS domain S-box-containing protein
MKYNFLLFKQLYSFFQSLFPCMGYPSAIEEYAPGLWNYDIKRQKLFLSPNLAELTGYTTQEIADQPLAWWISRIHAHDQPRILQTIQDLKNRGQATATFRAFRFLDKNNNYIWLENYVKVLSAKNNNPLRLAGIIINVTSFKLTEIQLQATLGKYIKETETKTRFFSGLNHDLRSPLSGIIGMVSLLRETSLVADQKHYIDNIANSTEMLLTLVNNMLEISRLASKKFEMEKISFSPVQVIRQVSELTRSILLKKDLIFSENIDGNIPDLLMGDPTRLQQILVNLLSNAVKFTAHGNITLGLLTDSAASSIPANEQQHTILRFEIIDTGIGIAPEVQGKLFQEFTQADTSISRLYGGTGLGLSICKELVQLMKGKIGVYSELGKGSTFWFEIPFESPVKPSPSSSEKFSGLIPCEPSQFQQTGTEGEKLIVLLAEDNLVNQEVMTGLLTCLGDEVIVANNGQEAVDLFQTRTFDIVLMDLNMPILDGLRAAQLIRQLPNGDVPIIAVTANTFIGDKDTCYYHGITSVLTKPVNKEGLRETLNPHRRHSSLENRKVTFPADLPDSVQVDKSVLNNLIKDLGYETISRLLGLYRTDGLDLVNRIKNSPHEKLANLAHTLAGMSENMGFTEVGKTARLLMDTISKTPENIQMLVERLGETFNNSLAELDKMETEGILRKE